MIKRKVKMYSIKLSDRHRLLLDTTAKVNNTSRAKVIEDSLNQYFNISTKIER